MQQSMYHQPPPVYHQNAAAGNALFPLATTADAPSRIPAAEPKLRKSYRPKMSCHQCRFRKVKCDRVKPCGSCCNRGKPDECYFTGEANNRAIDQSQEIKALRKVNKDQERRIHYLQEQLTRETDARQHQQHGGSGPFKVEQPSPDFISRPGHLPRFRTSRPRRFKGDDLRDNIYFGNLSLTELITAYSSLTSCHPPSSLTHPLPHSIDTYFPQSRSTGQFSASIRPHPPTHPSPFPCLWHSASRTTALLSALPKSPSTITAYISSFSTHAQLSFCFPHEHFCTFSESGGGGAGGVDFERFLGKSATELESNAEREPGMLALLFAVMAQGLLFGTFDTAGGRWVKGRVEEEVIPLGNVFIAASMQALRLSSFMNHPTLLSLETLLLIGPYLIDTGRFLDASTLFGLTIRVAQGMGLHRAPHILSPAPPPQEATLRQSLWWWLLHLDAQYSMMLGRPLGISGVGDCPPPGSTWVQRSSSTSTTSTSVLSPFSPYDNLLNTSTTTRRFTTYLHTFTLLTRQILSSAELMTNSKIDEFSDRLLATQATLPTTIQFCESWVGERWVDGRWTTDETHENDFECPIDWPMNAHAALAFVKCHTYLVLINRQRVENDGDGATPVTQPDPQQPLRGLPRVLASCRAILHAFAFFQRKVPLGLMDWTLGQQAFNAAMLLAMSWTPPSPSQRRQTTAGEDCCRQDIASVTRAYRTFIFIAEYVGGGSKGVAALAAQQLGRMLRAGSTARNVSSKTTSGKKSDGSGAGCHGILLLEDPGLQGCAQERFENPLGGWRMLDVMDEGQTGGGMLGSSGGALEDMLVPTPSLSNTSSSTSIPKIKRQSSSQDSRYQRAAASVATSKSTNSLTSDTTTVGAPQPPGPLRTTGFDYFGSAGGAFPIDFDTAQMYAHPYVVSSPSHATLQQQHCDVWDSSLGGCSADLQPSLLAGDGVTSGVGFEGMMMPPGTASTW